MRANLIGAGAVVFLMTGSLLSGCAGPKLPEVIDGALIVPERRAAQTEVTRLFGESTVRPGSFYWESDKKPWSAYWYPHLDPILFDNARAGRSAPIEKYDQYLKKAHKLSSKATKAEETLFKARVRADSGDGLCMAWAKAAILEDEPEYGAVLNDIDFRVGDIKALLIKSYEAFEGHRILGERNQGNNRPDYMDLYPDQLHRFMQIYLEEQRKPFIMDHDATTSVWNVPVFRAAGSVTQDASNPHLLHVEVLIGYAGFLDDRNGRPAVDSVGRKSENRLYTYDLYGEPLGNNSWRIKYGVWTGRSENDHPDYVVLMPETGKRKSFNAELDVEKIDEITHRAKQEGRP